MGADKNWAEDRPETMISFLVCPRLFYFDRTEKFCGHKKCFLGDKKHVGTDTRERLKIGVSFVFILL